MHRSSVWTRRNLQQLQVPRKMCLSGEGRLDQAYTSRNQGFFHQSGDSFDCETGMGILNIKSKLRYIRYRVYFSPRAEENNAAKIPALSDIWNRNLLNFKYDFSLGFQFKETRIVQNDI